MKSRAIRRRADISVSLPSERKENANASVNPEKKVGRRRRNTEVILPLPGQKAGSERIQRQFKAVPNIEKYPTPNLDAVWHPLDTRTMSRRERVSYLDKINLAMFEVYTCMVKYKVSEQDLPEAFKYVVSRLKYESNQLSVELGYAFSDAAVSKMREFFGKNYSKHQCIGLLNRGLKQLLGPDIPTGSRIKDPEQQDDIVYGTMTKLEKEGFVSRKARLEYLHKRKSGELIPVRNSTLRPDVPSIGGRPVSVWDTLRYMTLGDAGWTVMTMSIADGWHSVTLLVDNRDPYKPVVFWVDQLKEHKGGLKISNKAQFDAKVHRWTMAGWRSEEKMAAGTKRKTILDIWKLRPRAPGG